MSEREGRYWPWHQGEGVRSMQSREAAPPVPASTIDRRAWGSPYLCPKCGGIAYKTTRGLKCSRFEACGWRLARIAQQKGPRYQPSNRTLAFARDKHRCLRCGSTERLTIDHIRPRSKGGTNGLDNLQVLCEPCNAWKGTKTIDFRAAS